MSNRYYPFVHQDDPRKTSGPPPQDRDQIARLISALTTVKKLGVRNPKLTPPPLLLDALGINPRGPRVKQQFQAALQSACGMLERDRCIAFLMAAGLRPDVTGTRGEVIKQIQEALATSRRSAYRRIHEATEDLALLLHGGEFSPTGDHDGFRAPKDGLDFVTLNTRCIIDLTTGSPLVQMTRTIQSLRHELSGLEESILLPGLHGETPGYTALSNCQLDGTQLDGETLNLRLGFPRPLLFDERLTFTTRLQVPNHEVMGTSMLFSPATNSQHLQVSLNFSAQRQPQRVERFDGVWHVRLLNDDARGEVVSEAARDCIEFPTMRPGYVYGVKWYWPEESRG